MNTPKGLVDDGIMTTAKDQEVLKKSKLLKEPSNGLLSEEELDGVAGGNILPSVRISVEGSISRLS
ncbi:MAG: hypothetical protein R3Y67_06280 [Eubacteriales bacterium]